MLRMLFRASQGRVLFLLLLFCVCVQAQTDETVASVNGRAITLQEVDETVSTAIAPLEQQLYAIRKVALENLITTRVLEAEARARGVPVEELRQVLTRSDVSVTRA